MDEARLQLPFNTPFHEIKTVLKACSRQPRGLSKSAIRRILKIGERTLQYKKYALFWTGWIAVENGKFILTDLGSSYLRGSNAEKRLILWRQIKRFPPYHRPLKLTWQDGRSRLTKEFVQDVWRREFAKQILWDVNPQKFERAPKFFIETCKVAGLGSTISVDGALALEVARARLEEYIGLSQRVFIGHGHNELLLTKVVHFIEDTCGLNPIVVKTLPDQCQHILTKVLKHLKSADYAVFLFTGDDFLASGEKQPRPNVVFELGVAVACLMGKICMLIQKGIAPFSDIQGVLVKFFDGDEVEGTFPELRREMREAGLDC
jgi:hypothetical protein